MDLNIVTLEIAHLIYNFDYFDALVSEATAMGADVAQEQLNIRNKSKKHLSEFLDDVNFYTPDGKLRSFKEINGTIKKKLKSMKNADIHAFIENLEKDAKLIKKLYKANRKRLLVN